MRVQLWNEWPLHQVTIEWVQVNPFQALLLCANSQDVSEGESSGAKVSVDAANEQTERITSGCVLIASS